MTISIVVFSFPLGQMSDRVGRKPLILIGRGLLFTVTLLYALAMPISDFLGIPGVWIIYIANAIAGFCVASATNSITAYIYDVAPIEERGSHLAVYNTFTGIIYLLGSLIAGLLGEALVLFVGSFLAVFYMLIASTILRVVGSFFYVLIEEPKTYTSSIRKEIRAFVTNRRHDSDVIQSR
jgi:MFS family permease